MEVRTDTGIGADATPVSLHPIVDSPAQLRVLVLDEEPPYPPDAGKRIRTWNLLRRLAQRHQVSLLCYGTRANSAVAALEAAGICVYLVPIPATIAAPGLYLRLLANVFSRYPYSVDKHYSDEFQRCFQELVASHTFDLVHCEWTPYARYLRDFQSCPVLIATHNVESQIWIRRALQSRSALERQFFGLQATRMERFERQALRRAQAVTAVTQQDRHQMQSWGIQNPRLVENGVDLDYYSFSATGDDSQILFLASLDWYPNRDALDYFLEEIMPLVRSARPEVKFVIVGRRPPDNLVKRVAELPCTELAADVPDVRPYLRQATVVVVPLRIGGGSRLKILESLAAGKAVVSSSIGAEGLQVQHNLHLRLADEPREFASSVLELLGSAAERTRLGSNGRQLVTSHYSWDKMADALESAWFAACRRDSSDSLATDRPKEAGSL